MPDMPFSGVVYQRWLGGKLLEQTLQHVTLPIEDILIMEG